MSSGEHPEGGQESDAWGDAGYQGVDKREEFKDSKVHWEVAMHPGKRRALDPERERHRLLDKVEYPFRVVKQQFGYAKARYRGLGKDTAWLAMLFVRGNLWMARRQLMAAQG